MQLEVAGFVADGKVAVGHLGFGGVDCHLVASQPALITCHCCSVDSGASEIQVHIEACVKVLPLVRRLDLAALLSLMVVKQKGSVKMVSRGSLQTWLFPSYLKKKILFTRQRTQCLVKM